MNWRQKWSGCHWLFPSCRSRQTQTPLRADYASVPASGGSMGLPFLAVLLLSALPQLSILPYSVSTPPQDGVSLAAQAPPPPPSGAIKEIRFVGLRRLSPETLRIHTSSRVGEPLDQATIERAIRALAVLGWF